MIQIDQTLNIDTSIKDPQHRVTVVVSIVDSSGARVESASATCGVGDKGTPISPVLWSELLSAEKRAHEAAVAELKIKLVRMARNAEIAAEALAELEENA